MLILFINAYLQRFPISQVSCFPYQQPSHQQELFPSHQRIAGQPSRPYDANHLSLRRVMSHAVSQNPGGDPAAKAYDFDGKSPASWFK